jgi:hypothetical protein
MGIVQSLTHTNMGFIPIWDFRVSSPNWNGTQNGDPYWYGDPHIGMGRDMSIFQIGESPYRYGVHSNLGTNIYMNLLLPEEEVGKNIWTDAQSDVTDWTLSHIVRKNTNDR